MPNAARAASKKGFPDMMLGRRKRESSESSTHCPLPCTKSSHHPRHTPIASSSTCELLSCGRNVANGSKPDAMSSSLLPPSAETLRPSSHPSRPAGSLDARKPVEASENGDVEMLRTASVGRLSESVYERLLPRWRMRIRQLLCRSLAWEMPWLEFIQVCIFIATSVLSHSG